MFFIQISLKIFYLEINYQIFILLYGKFTLMASIFMTPFY
jgi:hypothetical protein